MRRYRIIMKKKNIRMQRSRYGHWRGNWRYW